MTALWHERSAVIREHLGKGELCDAVNKLMDLADGPKQIAMTANQVVNLVGHRLIYLTDTMPGSSGSPVFNDLWQVVAIHHAGGNLVVNPRGDKGYANAGILSRHLP